MKGQEKATLHFYVDDSQKPIENADVSSYLEEDGKLYEIGLVSSYGLGGVKVSSVDRTNDGVKEIEIVGGMGAAYVQLTMLSYNEEANKWLQVVQMGSPEYIDLDGDGTKELVASSRGSIPPSVRIYRWNGNGYEMADIAKETGNNYAQLNRQNGSVLVDTGMWKDSEPVKSKLYKYIDGKLLLMSHK